MMIGGSLQCIARPGRQKNLPLALRFLILGLPPAGAVAASSALTSCSFAGLLVGASFPARSAFGLASRFFAARARRSAFRLFASSTFAFLTPFGSSGTKLL